MTYEEETNSGEQTYSLVDYEDEEEYYSNDSVGAPNTTTCETCDKYFESYWKYQKHMFEHKTCGIDGCTFSAHEKVVEKHIQMQHYTGLYDKIKNVDTPDDVAKWIAERKKRFAYLKNAGKKDQAQEEKIKRGERLQRNAHKFDRKNKTRFALKEKPIKKKRPKRKYEPKNFQNTPISLIDDKSDWNGKLFPFRGTSQLYPEEVVEEKIDIDDSEWNECAIKGSEPEKIVLNNALGNLMCAYNSTDDSEIDDILPKKDVDKLPIKVEIDLIKEKEESANLSDDEPPTEEKIERIDKNASEPSTQEVVVEKPIEAKENKRKRFRKKGQASNQKVNTRNIYKRRKVTLLERLLANDIVHERNVVLQCIRHVVSNDFFKQSSNYSNQSNTVLKCVKYVVANNFFKENCDIVNNS